MSKNRTITGFGPITATFTSVQTGSWMRFGPFVGNTLGFQAAFSASTVVATSKIQGTLTTASTGGVVTLATRTSTQATQIKSTSALVFAFIRFASTALTTNRTLTMTAGAVP